MPTLTTTAAPASDPRRIPTSCRMTTGGEIVALADYLVHVEGWSPSQAVRHARENIGYYAANAADYDRAAAAGRMGYRTGGGDDDRN